MPVVVTAQNVLAQIATDDGLAAGVDGMFGALSGSTAAAAAAAIALWTQAFGGDASATPAPSGAANPYFATPNGAATLAAWKARYAAYLAWSAMTKDGLTGITGGWFGVPAAGNQAIAWGLEFGPGSAGRVGWADIVNAIAAGKTPPKVAADVVSQQDVADGNLAGLPGVPVPPTVVTGTPTSLDLSSGTKLVLGIAAAALLVSALKK